MSKISNASCPESLDFNMKLLGEDKEVNLCQEYLGKVILVVKLQQKIDTYLQHPHGLSQLVLFMQHLAKSL